MIMRRLIHPFHSAFYAFAIVSSVLLLQVVSSQEVSTNLWTSNIAAQPTAVHYSKTEDLLYAFGHNPARVVSLNPNDGSIVEAVELPASTTSSSSSFGVIRHVVVRESKFRMDFAILNVDEGVGSGRIICWDFYNRLVRWEFDAGSMSLPTVGKPALSDDGTQVFQHFKDGEIYALNAYSGEVLWQKKFFPMAGWTYVNGQLYGGIVAEIGGNPISPGIYHVDANTGTYQNRWRAPHRCYTSGSMNIFSQSSAGTHDNCNNIWTNSIASRSGEYLYVMDDYFGLMKFDTANIAAGPIWTNSFSIDNAQGSQQSYYPPVLSSDGSTVYASAYWTTAAIDTDDGSLLWTASQSGEWLTRDLVLSRPFGDALYAPYNFAIHKIDTITGIVELETDKALLNTMVVQSSKRDKDRFFAAGVNVHAFSTDLAPTVSPAPVAAALEAPSPPLVIVGLQDMNTSSAGVATQLNSAILLLLLPSTLFYLLL
mmetsp:Transcript_1734/g.2684  ORF Transcript_1734/g.2684 Transcript_1734/m.2684 type:complete len:482 (+) Transcript_1734:101-1546(+)